MKKTNILFLLIVVLVGFSCKKEPATPSLERYINDNWHIISSANLNLEGKAVSSSGIDLKDWYPTQLPSTVLASLVANKEYTDIFLDTNLKTIPREPFEKSWWYRAEFDANTSFTNTDIIFEGINYKANIWLNGELVADTSEIEHPFMIFDLNITRYLKDKNILAVEVFPAAKDALTMGFVDWNPEPPDRNMGLWRGVKLVQSGAISLKNIHVKTKIDKENYKWANLTIVADAVNNSNEEVSGTIRCEIEGTIVSHPYTIAANTTKKIEIIPETYEQLTIKNPKLWWPVNMGGPNLYTMNIKALTTKGESFTKDIRFGIREVSDYVNEKGYRGYMVNGKKVLIRGGGWVDDMLLRDSDEKVRAQVAYTKHMGLNTIRHEGFWGNGQAIFDACDENGILLMIGLSCQWEWMGHCGRKEYEDFMSVETPEDIEMISKAYRSQVQWLNNHPSVYVWVLGSDKLLFPDFERKLTQYINETDGTRPLLSSCMSHTSEVSGPSKVKMVGPYDYVTPDYWYKADELGGAYGFNTETGPGPQIPPLESIQKMLSKQYQWPVKNPVWSYHLGRGVFQRLGIFFKAFNNRYGEATSVEDLASRVQLSNYETMRAMFESFAVNKYNSTGVIQWMLNSAWPEMYWQLYDWYLMPNGAFYGAKAACQPLNLAYNYKDKDIYLTNEYLKDFSGLTANIKILDINSKELLNKDIPVEIAENSSKKIFEMPEIKGLTSTYFLDLTLTGTDSKIESENFYWLSTKEDIQDFEKSSWFHTPLKAYADFTALNNLPKAEISANPVFSSEGNNYKLEVILKNNSDKLAFFIEMKVVGDASGQSVLPVFWNNNYVSLLPGEEKVFTARFDGKNLHSEKPVFKMMYLNQ